MAVVAIKGGKVVATYRDVSTPEEATTKYPRLNGFLLVVADHPAGTLYDGSVFSAPTPTPTPADLPSDYRAAIWALARLSAPAVRAEVEAAIGGDPVS